MKRSQITFLPTEDKNTFSSLLVILIIATAVRLPHLDTLSLWFDEAIVPAIASKPLGYLVDWINTKEMHPPLYHLFIKGILYLGTSDFALRLPSVLLGLVGILLMYKVGEQWVDRRTGLFAALFLSLNPAHVYISREVRPYALASIFLMVGLLLLHRLLERKDNRTLYWLSLTQGFMLGVVYTALIPILFMQAVSAVVFLRDRGWKASLTPLAVNAVLTLGPASYFLASCMYHRHGHALNAPWTFALNNFVHAASGIFSASVYTSLSDTTYFWICFSIISIGLVRLWYRNRRTFWLCLTFFCACLAFAVLVRTSFHYAYWHLFSLYPFAALLAGTGMGIPCRTAKQTQIAVLIIAALWLPFFTYMWSSFYFSKPEETTFRTMGQAVAGLDAPGEGILVDTSLVDLINWYADKFSLVNRLKEQTIQAYGKPIVLHVLENKDPTTRIMPLEGDKAPIGLKMTQSQDMGSMTLDSWLIENPGVIPLTDPVDITLGSEVSDFYGHVATADRVMVRPYWGYTVIPTVNDTWTSFSYKFVNDSQVKDRLISFKLAYNNHGKGGYFVMNYHFDEEQPAMALSTLGPVPFNGGGPEDGHTESIFTLRRTQPFRVMTITLNMYCPMKSPEYPTSNLSTVGFRRLGVVSREVSGDIMNPLGLAPEYHVDGLLGLEQEGARTWRWGVGGKTVLRLPLNGPQEVHLKYGFLNHMEGQSYHVLVNGQSLMQEQAMPRQGWGGPATSGEMVFAGKDGDNVIEFVFSKVNHVNASMSDIDATPYTVAFTQLALEPLGLGSIKQ